MVLVTDSRLNESQISEPWFQVMDPISIADVCDNDLEKWSILKKNEMYLTVDQAETPIPMSDTVPFSSEKRVRDSICVYKERMGNGHHHAHRTVPKMFPKLTRFNTTSFGSTAPSTDQLHQKLKAYRQKLDNDRIEMTSEQLMSLEKELSATFQVVQQKLRSHGNNTSEKGTNSSSKTSLSSRASDLSKKAAKKVSRGFCIPVRCSASEHNVTPRPTAISRPSFASTTSKLAVKFRSLLDKQTQHSSNNSIESVATDVATEPPNTPTSHVIFNPDIWKLSPDQSTASIKPALRRASTPSPPPSPLSRARSSIDYTTEEPFERREWSPSENISPCTSIGPDDPSDCQMTQRGYAEYHSEHSGWDVRRISTASSESGINRPLGWDLKWDLRKTSAAYSASHYSRSISD
ncbi:hypothetical protein KCU65_g6799, partial [Aureobasidium melanogenum]